MLNCSIFWTCSSLRFELLSPFYANFSKPKVAKLCEKLSMQAQQGDVLCKFLFEQAGVQLAKMAQSLYKNAEKVFLKLKKKKSFLFFNINIESYSIPLKKIAKIINT